MAGMLNTVCARSRTGAFCQVLCFSNHLSRGCKREGHTKTVILIITGAVKSLHIKIIFRHNLHSAFIMSLLILRISKNPVSVTVPPGITQRGPGPVLADWAPVRHTNEEKPVTGVREPGAGWPVGV